MRASGVQGVRHATRWSKRSRRPPADRPLTGAGEHGLGGRLEEDAYGAQPLGGSAERDRERERAAPVGPERRTRLLAAVAEAEARPGPARRRERRRAR